MPESAAHKRAVVWPAMRSGVVVGRPVAARIVQMGYCRVVEMPVRVDHRFFSGALPSPSRFSFTSPGRQRNVSTYDFAVGPFNTTHFPQGRKVR